MRKMQREMQNFVPSWTKAMQDVHGSRYRCQSLSAKNRAIEKARKLLETLRPKFDDDPQRKVKGRHWKTHWRLLGDGVRACELLADIEEEIFALLRRFDKEPVLRALELVHCNS